MAEAIARGLVSRDPELAEEITVYDISTARTEQARATFGFGVATDVAELVRESGLVILAVKPGQIDAALFDLPTAAVLRIETPPNVQALKASDMDAAVAWRAPGDYSVLSFGKDVVAAKSQDVPKSSEAVVDAVLEQHLPEVAFTRALRE